MNWFIHILPARATKLAVLSLALLAACEEVVTANAPATPATGTTTAVTTAADDRCGASEFQATVGLSRSAIDGFAFEQPMRIIKSGEAVSVGLSKRRINFQLAEDGRIARVFCG